MKHLGACMIGALLVIAGITLWSQNALRLNPEFTEPLKSVRANEVAIIEHAQALSQQDLKTLAYLYARLNKPYMAEPLAQRALEREPGDQKLLLAMASMYLAMGNASKTIQYAKRILKQYPKNADGLYFLATGNQIARNPEQAREILLKLKRNHRSAEPYPYEVDLASAANESGDWNLAIQSYITILREYDLTPELRTQVRRALDTLYRTHNPQVETRFDNIDYGTGLTQTLGLEYSRPLSDRSRIYLKTSHIRNQIDEDANFFEKNRETLSTQVIWQHRLSNRYSTEFSGGVFADRPRFSGKITHAFDDGSRIGIGYDHARPSDDSLALRYLDGREHRANVDFSTRLPYRLSLSGNAYYRSTQIESQSLGSGYGMDWQLTYPLRYPNFQGFLSWRGAISRFDPNEQNLSLVQNLPYKPGVAVTPDNVRNLTSERIHREGIGMLWIRNLENHWQFEASAGADYYIHLAQISWDSGLRMLYRPRKSIEVSTGVIYSNTDNTGNDNADNIQLSVGIKKIF